MGYETFGNITHNQEDLAILYYWVFTNNFSLIWRFAISLSEYLQAHEVYLVSRLSESYLVRSLSEITKYDSLSKITKYNSLSELTKYN